MDAEQVNRMFAKAEQKYRGRACLPCLSRRTWVSVAYHRVFIVCDDCGAATPVAWFKEPG